MPQVKVLKELAVAGLQREFNTGSRIDTKSGCLFVSGLFAWTVELLRTGGRREPDETGKDRAF